MDKQLLKQAEINLKKAAEAFPDLLDIIVSCAKGGNYNNMRFDAAKTGANIYAKLNMTESAKEATRAMISAKRSKNEKEFEASMDEYGLLPDKKVKQIK